MKTQEISGGVDWHDLPVDGDRYDRLRLSPLTEDEAPGWTGDGHWKRAVLEILNEAVVTHHEYPSGRFYGRGIVVCASAKSGWSSGKMLPHGYFPGAWSLIHELRILGCTIPITFAYLGFEEMDGHLSSLVEEYGVETLDMRWRDWFVDPMRILAGWETKVYAILHAPYEEVLFLDADNIPVRNPEYLFEDPAYVDTGAMFWPDLPPNSRPEWLPKEVWDAAGMPHQPGYADFESGQLIVNKKRCWRALNVCRCINEYSDYWYKLVFGDKSTFFLAWNKVGQPYAMPTRGAGWHRKAILQHDTEGQLVFQHVCQDKPSLGGYAARGYLLNEARVHSHISELAKLWDGHLWHFYDSTNAHREAMEKMAGKYEYERLGLDSRILELHADGEIGEGRAECEAYWRLHQTPDHGKIIVLYREDRAPMVVLAKHQTAWWGQWLHFEKCRAMLKKLSD